MLYSIIVDGELQTSCTSLDKAEHIIDIYKQSGTFPDSKIEILEDPIERAEEDDLLSQLLKESNFSYA